MACNCFIKQLHTIRRKLTAFSLIERIFHQASIVHEARNAGNQHSESHRPQARRLFLRADFEDLGGYDQVGRALGKLVKQGQLLKLGQGLYTRAQPSLIDGAPAPVKGFRSLATEALGRLGIKTLPTRLEQAYTAGETTQVPAGRVVAVTKRVRRKISYSGIILGFERA